VGQNAVKCGMRVCTLVRISSSDPKILTCFLKIVKQCFLLGRVCFSYSVLSTREKLSMAASQDKENEQMRTKCDGHRSQEQFIHII
jgi:hypothetical protein